MPKGVYERTEEHLKIIRVNGKKGSDSLRGIKKGKMPDYIRKKISIIHIQRGTYNGFKNPAWKGGRWGYLKRKALKRDDYKCQGCGFKNEEFKGSALDIDHKLSVKKFPELRYELDNLITLCPNCHRLKSLKEKDYLRNRR